MSIAADIMKKYVESGGYRTLKFSEEKKKRLVSNVEKHLRNSESKRHEFPRYGLVAKYTVKRDYFWDYAGLNEYLADLGLLIPVATLLPDKQLKKLDVLDDVVSYQLPVKEYSVRPNFNKKGKELNAYGEDAFDHFADMKLNMLLSMFDATQKELKHSQEYYENMKRQILSCPVLRQEKKVMYEYGSLSLIAKKEGYDIQAIAEDFGVDFIIEYGKPNMEKLQNFILQGTITQQEVYQFRKDVTSEDKGFSFTLMTLEDEQKQLELLSNRTLEASLNRYKKAN